MSWAVSVTRHEGYSPLTKTMFPTETRLVKHLGNVQTFTDKADAEAVCQHYRHKHSEDEYSICRKSYKVVSMVNGHGTG